MLIDTGSELNIMTSDHASVMELLMDPAGAAWMLQGVSGHQIALEGLCRDVPISIGGVEVNHNFFITQDKLVTNCAGLCHTSHPSRFCDTF